MWLSASEGRPGRTLSVSRSTARQAGPFVRESADTSPQGAGPETGVAFPFRDETTPASRHHWPSVQAPVLDARHAPTATLPRCLCLVEAECLALPRALRAEKRSAGRCDATRADKLPSYLSQGKGNSRAVASRGPQQATHSPLVAFDRQTRLVLFPFCSWSSFTVDGLMDGQVGSTCLVSGARS